MGEFVQANMRKLVLTGWELGGSGLGIFPREIPKRSMDTIMKVLGTPEALDIVGVLLRGEEEY